MTYEFKQVTDGALFDAFVKDNGGTVFRTSAWARVKTAWTPRLFMAFEGNRPVMSVLCLERNVRFLGRLWYAAEGFTGDKSALEGMVSFLKKKMKEYGVFGICTDPALPLKINGEAVSDTSLISELKALGFKTSPSVSVYAVQPPTEVIVPVEGRTDAQLIAACEKGVKNGYKNGSENGLFAETYSGSDVEASPELSDRFFSMMTQIADRVEFVHRSKDYYCAILKALGKDCELRFVYYDRRQEAERCEKARQKAQETIKAISDIPPEAKGAKQTSAALKKELAALEKRIRTYEKASAEIDAAGVTDEKIYLGCGMTSYFGQTSVCLYGGTVDLLRNTLRPTNFLNLGRLLESRARGCRAHSMGRITGDPYDEDNPLHGLLNYKKSYGGDVIEYVGDLTLSGGTGLKMYAFTRLFPKIRHFRSTAMRRLINRRQS